MRLVKNSIDDIDFPMDWCLRSKSRKSNTNLVYIAYTGHIIDGSISYNYFLDENCIVFGFEI